jgi:phosphonate transport system ATP-binding protein
MHESKRQPETAARAAGFLRFEGVGKCWPSGTVAMSGIDLEVPRGQFCVVLGPSGAGKSTLLRCVNGLVSPTEGRVVMDGVTVGRRTLRRLRPRIAMVHQQFNLVDRLPVLDNVLTGMLAYTGTLRSMLRMFTMADRRRACRLLADVGLGEEHLYRRASQLSGGQQQRVAIARAFIAEPDVVLADEPVASLDPKISADILALLRAASRRAGATVLCSLHQVDLARQFADRIVAMRSGRLVFDGAPSELTDGMLGAIYHDQTDDGNPRSASPVREKGRRTVEKGAAAHAVMEAA